MIEVIGIWAEVCKSYCTGEALILYGLVVILDWSFQRWWRVMLSITLLCLNNPFQPLDDNNSRCLLYLIINHQLFELITLVSQHLHDGWQNSHNFNFHQSVSKRWASATAHQPLRVYMTIIMIVPDGVLHKMSQGEKGMLGYFTHIQCQSIYCPAYGDF